MALSLLFFFFNDTATTEIYTLSLHDALPISRRIRETEWMRAVAALDEFGMEAGWMQEYDGAAFYYRSEEHTSELQSLRHLVCRLLLEKKKRIRRGRSVLGSHCDQSLRAHVVP